MTVQGMSTSLYASSALNSTSLLTAINSTVDTTSTSSLTLGAADTPSADVKISKQAQMMSKLAELQKSDPEKFKVTLTKAADDLKTAASKTSGTEADKLNTLATTMQNIADGKEDITALQPKAPPKPQAAAAYQAVANSSNSQNTNNQSGFSMHHRGQKDSSMQAIEQAFQEISDAVSSSAS